MTAMSPRDEPVTAQIADDLRERIERGELRPGDQVPSERDLAEQHGVARMTARVAVDQLVNAGLVIRYRDRRGTVVRQYDPLVTLLSAMERGQRRDNPTLALDDWAAGVREQGREPRQVVTVHQEPAPEWAVERLPDRIGLRVEAGERTVLRLRMRSVDDRPVQVVESWFPWDVANTPVPGTQRRPLLESPPETNGDVVLPGGILAAIGRAQVHASDRISAEIAGRSISDALALPAGTVLLRHTRVGYDVAGVPVRLMVTLAPTDRNVLGYERDL
jgi:GntR family transcriptional regulator